MKYQFYSTVVFLENELLYGTAFEMSDEAMKDDFLIPIGKGKIERSGSDVTLVAHSLSVQKALEAAKALESEGISAEVSVCSNQGYRKVSIWRIIFAF